MSTPRPSKGSPASLSWRLALAGLLALTGQSASAFVFLVGTEASSLPGPGGSDKKSTYSFAPQAIELSSQRSGMRNLPDNNDTGLVDATATAWARADMAGLHLTARSAGEVLNGAPYGGGSFSASAKANAALADSFTLSVAGMPADRLVNGSVALNLGGSLLGDAQRDGSLQPGNPGNAESWISIYARMVVSDNTGTIGDLRLQRNCYIANNGPFNCSGDALGLHTLPVTLHNQSSINIDIEGEIRSSVIGGQSGGGNVLALSFADLSHTIAWGGILGLTGSDGQPVGSYTALSAASGFDYAQPFTASVPEPGPALLMVAGLAALTLYRRRLGSIG